MASPDSINRLMSLIGSAEPLDVLQRTPGHLRAIVAAQKDSHLRIKPGAGKWSALEVMGHLGDHEVAMSYRLRGALFEEAYTMRGYQQERWVSEQLHNEREPREILDVFDALRQDTIRLWQLAESRDLLSREVTHSSRGRETLSRWRMIHAGHDLTHLRQIEACLELQQARES